MLPFLIWRRTSSRRTIHGSILPSSPWSKRPSPSKPRMCVSQVESGNAHGRKRLKKLKEGTKSNVPAPILLFILCFHSVKGGRRTKKQAKIKKQQSFLQDSCPRCYFHRRIRLVQSLCGLCFIWMLAKEKDKSSTACVSGLVLAWKAAGCVCGQLASTIGIISKQRTSSVIRRLTPPLLHHTQNIARGLRLAHYDHKGWAGKEVSRALPCLASTCGAASLSACFPKPPLPLF
jgi:hypothetical protein